MNKKDLLLLLLEEAVDKCYLFDKSLIDRSMEQASVARIFYYMQELLKFDNRFFAIAHYNLDSEYNKDGEEIKDTPRCKKGTRPDILLHKRWESEASRSLQDNALIVEFKPCQARFRYFDMDTQEVKEKRTKATDKEIDFVKLEDFTRYDTYRYYLGVYVKLNKKRPLYKYFQQGIEKNNKMELSND